MKCCGFTEEGKAGTLFEGVVLTCTLAPHGDDVPHEDENLFRKEVSDADVEADAQGTG